MIQNLTPALSEYALMIRDPSLAARSLESASA
jgi:hypothetical protein